MLCLLVVFVCLFAFASLCLFVVNCLRLLLLLCLPLLVVLVVVLVAYVLCKIVVAGVVIVFVPVVNYCGCVRVVLLFGLL